MSTFLKLNWKDLAKGFVVAIITALITACYQIIQTDFTFDWLTFKPAFLTAIAAGLSYLIKNLFTNSVGDTFKTDNNADTTQS